MLYNRYETKLQMGILALCFALSHIYIKKYSVLSIFTFARKCIVLNVVKTENSRYEFSLSMKIELLFSFKYFPLKCTI